VQKIDYFVKHIQADVSDLSLKIKLNFDKKLCIYCNSYICTVGNDNKLLFLLDKLSLENLNFDDFFLVKTIMVGFLLNKPFFYYKYEIFNIKEIKKRKKEYERFQLNY